MKRLVIFAGGYDPKSPADFFARLRRELMRHAALWGVDAALVSAETASDGETGWATIVKSLPDGSVQADFLFLCLDRLVLRDFASALPKRLGRYLAFFWDYAASGALGRVGRANRRFLLYLLYPLACLVAFALAAAFMGSLAGARWGVWAGVGVGAVAFLGLLGVLGRRRLLHLMDLWSFSGAYIHGRRPDADALFDRFARLAAHRAEEGNYGDVVFVGHSTGGALIIDIADRVLRLSPGLPEKAPVSVLTLGSTALKIGLHPAASAFRERVRRLADLGNVFWIEVQSVSDLINFYRTDPLAEMGIDSATAKAKRPRFPTVVQVRIREMVSDDFYRKIRMNVFRRHYQYVMGNTKKSKYDFFNVCCGASPLPDQVERPMSSTAAKAGKT